MNNLLKSLLSIFIKTKADDLTERKEKLKEKLQNEIDRTDSEWVKARNTAYLVLIDGANEKVLDEIEKAIDKI